MQTFAELKNRYVIDCTLSSEAAIHVGSGEASNTADSAALQQAGKPLIPGSSMRGTLRSLLERMVVSLRLPMEVKPCVLFSSERSVPRIDDPGISGLPACCNAAESAVFDASPEPT